MRTWMVVGVAGLAGCVSTAQPRFEAGPPLVLGIADARSRALEARVKDVAAGQREAITRCFDLLGERHETPGLLAVVATLSVQGGETMLTALHAANPETVVDRDLQSCLSVAVSGFRLDGAEAELRLPIRVTPSL